MKTLYVTFTAVLLTLALVVGVCASEYCIRGDVDQNGRINTADVVYIVGVVYGWNAVPYCDDCNLADVDGSGGVNIADAIYLHDYIYGGPAPVPCE